MSEQSPDDRLDSWKAISAYLKRDVTTVQRWEKREGMPVHRHVHDKLGSVYAYRSEIDAVDAAVVQPAANGPTVADISPPIETASSTDCRCCRGCCPSVWQWRCCGGRSCAHLPADSRSISSIAPSSRWSPTSRAPSRRRPCPAMDGSWPSLPIATVPGCVGHPARHRSVPQPHSRPRTAARQSFSAHARLLSRRAFVTFWARGVEGATTDEIGIWAVPTLGGQPKPYLEGVAEFDWSRDGTRVIYHTPGPGDPMFVGERGTARSTAEADLCGRQRDCTRTFHRGHPMAPTSISSRDRCPTPMDVWRMTPGGKERRANHPSQHRSSAIPSC